MPNRSESIRRPTQSASELLDLYDELTALNAGNAFVMQSLAAALTTNHGLDERAATGAVFCAEWLNDRAVALEDRLRGILARRRGPGKVRGTAE